MAEARVVQNMFSSIAARYDLTNSVLSLGIHHLWRKKLVSMIPACKDARVLDVCTGTGDLLSPLKERFGETYGIDFCFPMLKEALKKKDGSKGEIAQADALEMPFRENVFDVVSVAFGVRNFENLRIGLGELNRILKPGACLLILEFGQPRIPGFAQIFRWYSNYLMPIIGGILTGNRSAYTYLPKTSSEFPCREDFNKYLEDAGFVNCRFLSLSGGIAYIYVACKSSEAPLN